MALTSTLFAATDDINGALPAAAYGSADLGAQFLYPGPANTWVETGLAANLAGNGVWEIRGQLRGLHRDDTDDVVFALFDDSVSTTVPVANSEAQPGYVTGTNNVSDQHQTTGSYLFRYTVLSGSKTLKLKMKAAMFVASASGLLSDGNGRSRLVWEKVSGFTALTTTGVMETGEAQLATATQTVTTTDIDIAGCATPVLGAGVWRIDGFVTGDDTGASNIYAWLADQTNAIIPRSSVTVSNDTTAAGHGASANISIDVVSDGSKIVKLRGRGSASATIRNLNHVDGVNGGATTKIRWTKIASLVPVQDSAELTAIRTDNGTGSNSTTTSTTYVDVPGSVFTLATPGTWDIDVRGYAGNSIVGNFTDVALCTMAGTVVAYHACIAVTAGGNTNHWHVKARVTITTATQYKLMYRTRAAGTATMFNNNAGGLDRPTLAAIKVGGLSSIPGTVAEVSGSASIASNQVTAANTTPVDGGLSLIAPEAGTYEVEYEAVVSNAAAGGSVDTYITDANNNVQEDSRKRSNIATAGNVFNQSGSCRMTLAAGDVAKLRFASGGANIATLHGNVTNGFARLKWRKVAGYVAGPNVNFDMPAATAPVTVSNTVMQAGLINQVNLAANGNVDKPTTGANGAWFGVKVLGKPVLVRFASAAVPSTLRGLAQNYVIPGGISGLVIFAYDGATWNVVARDKQTERIQISRRGIAYGQSGGGAYATIADANLSDTSSISDGGAGSALPFDNSHVTFTQQNGTYVVGANLVTINRSGNYNFRVVLSADCNSTAHDAISMTLIRIRAAVRTIQDAQIGHSSENDGYGPANISMDFDLAVQEGGQYQLTLTNTAAADIGLKSFLFRVTEID